MLARPEQIQRKTSALHEKSQNRRHNKATRFECFAMTT